MGGFQTNRVIKVVFAAQGKFHELSGLGIHQYDFDAQQSTLLHSVSLEQLGPAYVVGWMDPLVAQDVDDEILAIVIWHPMHR